MKKRNFGFMLMLGVLSILFSSGKDSPDNIYWSEDYKLDWTDFKGEPRFENQQISALTSSGIVHYKGCKDGKIDYNVRAYFEKQESWVKEEARTEHHLIHEQIHFDITELYARKLRKLLADNSFACGQEVQFEAAINNFIQIWHNEQREFDKHTQHSLDRYAQKEWFHKIEMELSLLDDYK